MQAGNTSSSAPTTAQECVICMTDFSAQPAAMFQLSCPHAHAFCLDCIATEIKHKVEEGGRPRCPCCPTAATYLVTTQECVAIVGGVTKRAGGDSTTELMHFAGVLQKMERNLLRQGLAAVDGAVPCPGVDCENWMVPERGSSCPSLSD